MTDTPSIEEYMTPAPVTVDEALSVVDAQDRMFANNIRHLCVTRNDALVGVVSQRDLAVAISAGEENGRTLPVAVAMRLNPFTCSVDTPLAEVAREMESHRYGCAVVMNGSRPLGVFTTTDALRALREALTGTPAERQVRASHVVEVPKERPHVGIGVRASDLLNGALPSDRTGRL